MIDMDCFNLKFAKTDNIARLNNIEPDCACKTMLLKLTLDKSDCKAGAVNGHIDALEHICKSADMILMTVSYNDTTYLFGILFKIAEIGNNKVKNQKNC